MTPDAYQLALDGLNRTLPTGDDPHVVDVLEALADASPADAHLRDALLLAHDRFLTDLGLRPVVAGVQRERLVRWGRYDATWTGTIVATGGRGMVRCLRGPSARDPRLRRQLVRDVRALRCVVPNVRFDEADAAIMAPLPGPVFQEGPTGGHVSVAALARLVVGTVHHLQAWENAGLGIDDLDAAELRDAGDHLVVVCLTPQPIGTGTRHWQHITHLVDTWWDTHTDHPVADLLMGWRTFPPHSAAEAADACMAAMGEELARMRHTIVRQAEITRTSTRRERLDDLVARLDVSVPPPAGKAAIGVDLDGRAMQVISDGSTVSWGPIGEDTTVLYDEEDGFDVPAARRLVRMRGAGPVSARDNKAIGGTAAFADAITRWLGASLELRTIHLLLQATADAAAPEAW